MITTVKFAKTKLNAIIPTKRLEDAGYDVYPCFDEDYIIIKPHTTVIIPTGIASACDTDYCFVLHERSSTGTKGMAQHKDNLYRTVAPRGHSSLRGRLADIHSMRYY